MKKLIFTLFYLIIFAALAILFYRYPVNVTLNCAQFIVEFPLWIGIILVLALHYLLVLFNYLFSLPKRLRKFLQQRRTQKAIFYLNLAAEQLMLGEPLNKLKLLITYAPYSPLSNWHYLIAAQSALQQRDFKNCRLYLQKAHSPLNDTNDLADFNMAQLLSKQKMTSDAVHYLTTCSKHHPLASNVLTLLLKVYCEQEAWEAAAHLIMNITKRKLPLPKHCESLVITSYKNYLPMITSPKILEKTWFRLPDNLRSNPIIAQTYLKALLKFGETKSAEKQLLKSLQKKLNPELLDFYADFPTENIARLLKQAEIWLKNAPQLPELYLALAKLSLRQKLYGQAKAYLDQGSKLNLRPELFDQLRAELGD